MHQNLSFSLVDMNNMKLITCLGRPIPLKFVQHLQFVNDDIIRDDKAPLETLEAWLNIIYLLLYLQIPFS